MEGSDKQIVAGMVIRLHPGDNVVVAIKDIAAGEVIPGEQVTTREPIPAGFKIAARTIAIDQPIRKYNTVVGFASAPIESGSKVHSHNTRFEEFDRDYAYAREYQPVTLLPESERATFKGIVRPDGRVATRNYVGICSTVNCSATVARRIADWFTAERLADYPNIDGVVAFVHPLGCGMEMTGEPMDLLRRTVAGFATHPNLAAALIIGLGCERNQIPELVAAEKLSVGPKLRIFTIQDTGGTRKTIEAGIEAVTELLDEANRITRQTVPVSHLIVGLECGGSDAFSSLTANPALGAAVDLLVRHGGTAILSETPEIYGVEHTLTRRAATVEIGKKLIDRIRWWKDVYSLGRDVQINGVISPGNQVGGLANILEKSLGSAMKGGTGPMMEVYRYAEKVTTPGMVFMDTPGYDPVSVTGQIAGGANLIAFTTGRGSMFGAKPSPCIKLASNSMMYHRLEEDMDLNCGRILDEAGTVQEMGQEIFDLMIATASGKRSKSELLGLGDNEFAIWDIGIMN